LTSNNQQNCTFPLDGGEFVPGLVAGPGDRNIAESGVEYVKMTPGVGIDQDALSGEARERWLVTA
jgi:hypothetical protein